MTHGSASSHRTDAERPLRGLLCALPQLSTSAGQIDYQAADPHLLQRVGDDAATVAAVMAQGVGAIGHLLSQCGPAIEDGSIGADSVEALGRLLGELGDLAAACQVLAARCSAETSDFTPP